MPNVPKDVLDTWRLPAAVCPHCGATLDGATKTFGEEGGPSPGSLSICAECLAVNQFAKNEDGALQIVSFDIETLEPDEREELNLLLAHLRQRRN